MSTETEVATEEQKVVSEASAEAKKLAESVSQVITSLQSASTGDPRAADIPTSVGSLSETKAKLDSLAVTLEHSAANLKAALAGEPAPVFPPQPIQPAPAAAPKSSSSSPSSSSASTHEKK